MPKLNVAYINTNNEQVKCSLDADDEACAIGVCLDLFGDEIAQDSPFCVWSDTGPAPPLLSLDKLQQLKEAV